MTDSSNPLDVLFVSGDLFIGSRVRGAIESGGWTLDVVASGAMAVERLQGDAGYRLALVDLETPGVRIGELMAARSGNEPAVIAYGPHVHEKRLEAAREAGCDQVLTRGQFDSLLPQLLAEHLMR